MTADIEPPTNDSRRLDWLLSDWDIDRRDGVFSGQDAASELVEELRAEVGVLSTQLAEARTEADEAFGRGLEQVRRRAVAAEAERDALQVAFDGLQARWQRDYDVWNQTPERAEIRARQARIDAAQEVVHDYRNGAMPDMRTFVARLDAALAAAVPVVPKETN